MGTPTNRTPLRVARGTTSALNTGLSDIQEGEIVWDATLNRLQVKESSALVSSSAASDATKAPIASPTFTGTVAIPNIANLETAVAANTAKVTNVTTNLSVTANGTSLTVASSDGTDASIPAVTTSAWGAMTDEDKTKLDAIEAAADVTDATNVTAAGAGMLSADQNWTGAQRGAVTALTDGATIAVDFNSSNNFSVTLGGNRTLGQPSNQVVGQSGSIFVTQDGTGSRTLAYHADWDFAGGTAPTISSAANAVDRIDYIVAAANKIHAVATLDVK